MKKLIQVFFDCNYRQIYCKGILDVFPFYGFFNFIKIAFLSIFILISVLLIANIVNFFLNKKDLNKKPIIVKKIRKKIFFLLITVIIWILLVLVNINIGIYGKPQEFKTIDNYIFITTPAKPVIYLYPTQQTKVEVKLLPSDGFLVTYPEYSNGWNVTAFPDGKLINNSDNKEYSYLYWEGKNSTLNYDLSSGFVVAGKDTANFLQDKLALIGLTPKEYNEFIVYWLPRMVNNKYNLIHFATDEEYNQKNPLTISPTPDSILRVFMVFKPLSKDISIKPQTFSPFNRQGFSVVEWGGSEIK